MNFDTVVADTDLLGGLPARSLRKITETQRVRSIPQGSFLFREGEEGRAIYVLATGSIRLFRADEDGREAVMHLVRPGEVFAEAVLFTDEGYPVTAEAREDCQVVEIETARVLGLLEDPRFREDFFANVMRKLKYLAQQVYVLSSCDVRERLLRFLAGRYGRRECYRLELSKKEVASVIATTPETLSRVLARMEQEGTLSWKRREIRVAPTCWHAVEDVDV
ncbi:MAG: Crp/Fnr family transcriptional regulator [Spirochaetaceae bacterium]